MQLKLEIGTFEDVEGAFPVMVKIANRLGVEVVAAKNEVTVTARPGESADAVRKRYIIDLEIINRHGR